VKKVLNRSHGKTTNDVVYISKLQNIAGFDPNIIQNLQISMDVLSPAQMQVTMNNVRRLKELFPEMFKKNKLELRIRSVESKSPELQKQMQKAIDFTHEMKIATNETPMRFVSNNSFELLNLDRSKYFKKEGQWQLKEPAAEKAFQQRVCGGKARGKCGDCIGCKVLTEQNAETGQLTHKHK
jgi:hypothetical protein